MNNEPITHEEARESAKVALARSPISASILLAYIAQQEALERRTHALTELLKERVFGTGDRDYFSRKGFSLLIDEETAIRDINYRNAPLHDTIDEAIEAGIKWMSQSPT